MNWRRSFSFIAREDFDIQESRLIPEKILTRLPKFISAPKSLGSDLWDCALAKL
jgi:hypothetical protein